MQVEVTIRNTDLASRLRRYADRRLRFALSRFGDRVGQVVVAVSGPNDSAPDAATSCRITAELRPIGEVEVRETHPNLYLAIDRAAGRVGRLLALRLEQGKEVIPVRALKVRRGRTRKRNPEERFSKGPRRLRYRGLRVARQRGRGGKNASRAKSS
jgi:ribosome-associated translation inhibitor RaiA